MIENPGITKQRGINTLSQPRTLNVMSHIILKTEERSHKSHILNLNTQISKPRLADKRIHVKALKKTAIVCFSVDT